MSTATAHVVPLEPAGDVPVTGPYLRPIPSREPHPASRVDVAPAARSATAAHPAPVLPGLELAAVRRGLHVVPAQPQLPGPADPAAPGEEPGDEPGDEAGEDEFGLAAVYPEPGAWAARFLVTALEVAHGARPSGQLVRWVSPPIQEMLQRRGALAVRLRPASAGVVRHRLRVRSVRACRLAPDISEVAAVVQDGDRVRAVALRLEGLGFRWRVTALQIG